MQKKIIALLVLALLANVALFAGTTGKIAGKVKDQNGDPVPFANVLIEGLQQGAQTKENGTYIIINVQPGTYNLICSQMGYQASKTTGVKVNLDETTVVNISLNKTTIEVEGFVVTERKTELVSKTNTSSSSTISADDIEDIAVSDIDGLIATSAGAVQKNGELHVRGGRSNEVVYSVDGMSVSDPVDGGKAMEIDTDAIADMKVMTGGFTAEYGNAQSGIVNIVTKSGSAEYSGKIEFASDHLVDYDNPDDAFLPIYHSNQDQIKFAIGGPVLTPLVSSLRDKFTFYFNAALMTHDSRYHDLYVTDPVSELKYLTDDKFSKYDPYEDRESFLGFDLDSRNYNMYNYNFKTKYNIKPGQTVTFAVRGDYSDYTPYSHFWRYALENYATGESKQSQYIVTYDHTFNPQTTLKVKASRYHKEVVEGPVGIDVEDYFVKRPENFILEDPNDIYLNTGIDYLLSPANDFLYGEDAIYDWQIMADNNTEPVPAYVRPGSVYGSNVNDENTIFTTKADLEYQYNLIHGFKTGIEVIKHSIKKDQLSNPWIIDVNRYSTYLQSCIPADSMFVELDSTYVPLYNLDDLYDATIAASGSTDGYEADPWQFAYYFQDKMEFEGMNVNAGVRFDFWYLGEKYKTIKNNKEEWQDFDEDERFQMMVSPRLGISHPISEKSVLHFAYNYQNQLPQMQYVFTTSSPEDAILNSGNVIVGTPDLEPQITVTYEVGLNKQLSENYVMDITTYYKNIYNYVSLEKVYAPDDETISWYEYTSEDYGSARGIDINLSRMLSNFISGSTSYSLAWASGNNSGVTTNESLREFPLPWDMRHSYNLNLTFKIQKDEEFFVPFTDYLVPTVLTDDFSANFSYAIQSGTPYTPLNADGTAMDTNSELMPSTSNATLKLTKKFYLNDKASFRVYCTIDNLFNKENVNYVYGKTGSPKDDGTYAFNEETGTYYNVSSGEYEAAEIVEIYKSAIANPANVTQGRTLKLGVSFNF